MQPFSATFLDTAARHLERILARIEIQAEDHLLSEGWLNHELYLAVRENRPDLFCSREPFYTFDFDRTVDRNDLDPAAMQRCKMDIYVWDKTGAELFIEAKLLTPLSAANAGRASLDTDYDRLVRGCNGRRQGLQLLYIHSVGKPLEEANDWITKRGGWARRQCDFEHRLVLNGDKTNTFRLLAWTV
ncbi:hypothetical protein CRT60_00425 [Azospirillum palustre]|uniref:Uncharacterized protein n=1 Tax=Azospirillum palustre TaxID=2044885 RepID=A0A2B8BPT4_9PROT|nr:hypothetical protein [Azospirillum palustre]PGH59432.1 hypothetical protein CRT60_00425 [Azospirillum palustre]